MKKMRSPLDIYFNPFALWVNVAAKTAELLMASSEVIAARAAQLAALETQELTLMGSEKVEAFSRAAGHWLLACWPMQRHAWRALREWSAVGNAALALATSRTLGQAVSRRNVLAHAAAKALPSTFKASTAAARSTDRILSPIHGKASANAKRLRRRRR